MSEPIETKLSRLEELLEELEASNLSSSDLPRPLIGYLKKTTDHLRTVLWGIITATPEAQEDIATATARVRAERVTEMCEQLRVDIACGRLPKNSERLKALASALQRAEETVRRFVADSQNPPKTEKESQY